MKVKFNSRANREVRSIAEYYTLEVGAKHSNEFLDELEKIIDRIKLLATIFSDDCPGRPSGGLEKISFRSALRDRTRRMCSYSRRPAPKAESRLWIG